MIIFVSDATAAAADGNMMSGLNWITSILACRIYVLLDSIIYTEAIIKTRPNRLAPSLRFVLLIRDSVKLIHM